MSVLLRYLSPGPQPHTEERNANIYCATAGDDGYSLQDESDTAVTRRSARSEEADISARLIEFLIAAMSASAATPSPVTSTYYSYCP